MRLGVHCIYTFMTNKPSIIWATATLCLGVVRPSGRTAYTCVLSPTALQSTSSFYRAMVCIRGTSLCPCLSQVGVLSKRMNESSWILACELPSTRPTLC